MVFARRLLSAVLTLALAHFGVMATAPAHAHSHGDADHAIFAIELHDHDHHGFAGHDDHHDDVEQADPHVDDHPLDADLEEDGSDANGAKTVIHVHSCPQFAPAGAGAEPLVSCAVSARLRPPQVSAADARTTAPPFRPPQIL